MLEKVELRKPEYEEILMAIRWFCGYYKFEFLMDTHKVYLNGELTKFHECTIAIQDRPYPESIGTFFRESRISEEPYTAELLAIEGAFENITKYAFFAMIDATKKIKCS